MLLSNVVNELHNEHGLSNASTAKQTNLSSFAIRLNKVYDFNSRRKNLLNRCKILKFRRLTVYRIRLLNLKRSHSVYSFSHHVHKTPLNLLSYRHRYRCSRCNCIQPSSETVRRVHSHTSYRILPNMLLHLKCKFPAVRAHYLKRIVNRRESFILSKLKRDVHHRSHYLGNSAFCLLHKINI